MNKRTLNSNLDKLIWKEKVESTNTFAKNWVKDNPSSDEKVLVGANKQTGGRGRFGRNWFSPKGGLYFSLIESDAIFKPSLSLVVGVAIAESLEELTGVEIELKWPNDLLKNGEKVGGILLERSHNKLILGCGLNTFPVEAISSELSPKVSVIELGDISNSKLLETILSHLYDYFSKLTRTSFSEFRKEWKKRSHLLGKRVRVNFNDKAREEEGLFQDIGQNGELKLTKDGNDTLTFTSGNISLEKEYE